MRLGYKPNLIDNVRTMEVYVKSMGSSKLTPEEEKELLEDYSPVLEYKNLNFKGYYKMEGNNVVKANVIVTYKNKLNIEIPTIQDGSNGNESIVTIGTKTFTITTVKAKGDSGFEDEVKDELLKEIKADSDIVKVFNSSLISRTGNVINAVVETDIDVKEKVEAINAIYGEIATVEEVSTQEGDLVTLEIINAKLPINEKFSAKFMFETKKVRDDELGTILDTKDKIAEAKTLLFRDVITETVQEIVGGLKKIDNEFEEESESKEF